MLSMSPKAKTWVALIVTTVGAVLTALSQVALPDNVKGWVSGALLVVTILGTTFGVYQVPNAQVAPAPAEAGPTD